VSRVEAEENTLSVNCPDCGHEIRIERSWIFFSDGSTAAGCPGCWRTVGIRLVFGGYAAVQIKSRLNEQLAAEHAALVASLA
jgi:ribosomal protein S27E